MRRLSGQFVQAGEADHLGDLRVGMQPGQLVLKDLFPDIVLLAGIDLALRQNVLLLRVEPDRLGPRFGDHPRERLPFGVRPDVDDEPLVVGAAVGAGGCVTGAAIAPAGRLDTRALVLHQRLGGERQEAFELCALHEAATPIRLTSPERRKDRGRAGEAADGVAERVAEHVGRPSVIVANQGG